MLYSHEYLVLEFRVEQEGVEAVLAKIEWAQNEAQKAVDRGIEPARQIVLSNQQRWDYVVDKYCR